uniref:Uncharacterized protein n=1 Tax=Candidatus Kentrum sp. LFY TaxID=2126342 RepID=A0A450UUM4_9GAMM|nr:MAG: hypothetical protein BECKLFY1418A_GA0070994_105719 [Candidatus Kentron sp. LFY]
MGVGAAHAEGTHPRDAPFSITFSATGPGLPFHGNPEGEIGPIDMGIRGLEMQVGRDLFVLQRQYDLHQPRNARRCFQVSDIGLHRSDGER